MNWKTIIKEDAISKKNRDRRDRASSIAGKGKSPVKLVGDSDDGYLAGKKKKNWPTMMEGSDEESFEEHGELNEAVLAEMTRYDLLEKASEWIETLDKEELMQLLIGSQGDIDISSISYKGA